MPQTKLTVKAVEKILKNKKVVFAIEGTENEMGAWQSSLYHTLKFFSDNVMLFDPRKQILQRGYQQTVEQFLRIIQTERPDFCMVVPARDSTGFLTLEIIRKINKESPTTKILALLGDDDTHFECFSRYAVLFIDYALVGQHNYIRYYEEEGSGSKVFPIHVADTDLFKPLKTEKKYGVVFIGRPTFERIKWLRFLIKKGIAVKIWGHNWSDYPEFKDFYGGAVSNDELVTIINQSKINLSFSRNDFGELHYKGRIFEVAECNAFQLVEYFSGYFDFFKEDEIIMFKDEHDLLRKIQYYLEQDLEREKVARRAYEKVIKNYSLKIELKIFLKKVIEDEAEFHRRLPVIKKKIVMINKELLKRSVQEIMDEIEDAVYVSFFDKGDEIFEFKNSIQAYALEKTGKEMSCCGYYVSAKSLGDYLLFRSNLYGVSEDDFNRVVDLTQIMVSKNYFLKNLGKFQEFYRGTESNLVNKCNTAFIDVPLYRTERLKKTAKYGIMEKVFKGGCLFLTTLYSLLNRKKIFFDAYPYRLLLIPLLKRNTFVLKHLFASIGDTRYWHRLFGRKTDFAEL